MPATQRQPDPCPAPRHQPVLAEAVIEWLRPQPGGRCIDGTVGYGGHAERLLREAPGLRLLGLDRDPEALAEAARRLQPFGDRVRLVHGEFSRMAEYAGEQGWKTVDAVLLDVGVSSPQLDRPERGFSFREDGPLDMRMNPQDPVTAADILNQAPEQELARIFREFGEERYARRIARAVVRRRRERPWRRTAEFADAVRRLIRPTSRRGFHPATRCFQALRIAVNHELEELEMGLRAGVELLAPGGRMVIIAFHSLEDRIVKHRFRELATACSCPPWFPECRCGGQAVVRVLTRRPIRPTPDEIARNPRSASARLRAVEKLEPGKRSPVIAEETNPGRPGR